MNNQVNTAIEVTKADLMDMCSDAQYPWCVAQLSVISALVTDAPSVRRLINALEEGYYTSTKEELYASLGVDQKDYEVLAMLANNL
jgi:hypothetical protein